MINCGLKRYGKSRKSYRLLPLIVVSRGRPLEELGLTEPTKISLMFPDLACLDFNREPGPIR